MFKIDLCSRHRLPVSTPDATTDAVLRLAQDLIRIRPEASVRIPLGPNQRDRALIDGRLLAENGLAVF